MITYVQINKTFRGDLVWIEITPNYTVPTQSEFVPAEVLSIHVGTVNDKNMAEIYILNTNSCIYVPINKLFRKVIDNPHKFMEVFKEDSYQKPNG